MRRPDVETDGPDATEAAGAALAAELAPGDVVVIEGDLGAGKTTFVRGALRALGVTERVTSPTFVVGQLYESGRVRAAHLDLYRLGSSTEGEDPGLLDPFFGPDTVTFVEWPGPMEGTRRVTLAHAGGDRRRVEWS